MDQPHTGPSLSGSKTCWTCAEVTPYDQGFCRACWAELPEEVQRVYNYDDLTPASWKGKLFMAIVDGLRSTRFAKAARERPRYTPKPKVDLSDLEIEL